MKLISNWWEVLKRAWSVKLGALSALFAGLHGSLVVMQPGVIGLTVEQSANMGGVFLALSGLFAALVPFARVTDQGLAVPTVPSGPL